ncbi:hypothetical protein NQ318_006661 [Aromia moschata]|uniref:DUF4817 domain-containing protein n=1 Tax=Aromia moschata TaxID=1265417 RepID=A0AAV8YR17_9CUCU|nr:hypothetical protein NQ318_006661 [Aromia moschata]
MMIGYGDRAQTQCEVVRLFRERHPDLPPLNQGTISKIEAQYREMGHVRKVPSKRQAVVDDDTKLNLLLALEENPITPALAKRSNFGYSTSRSAVLGGCGIIVKLRSAGRQSAGQFCVTCSPSSALLFLDCTRMRLKGVSWSGTGYKVDKSPSHKGWCNKAIKN